MVGDDDDQLMSNYHPEISDDKIKDLLSVLRQQMKAQNESDQKVKQLRMKNQEQEDELFKVREENCALKQKVSALETKNVSLESTASSL